MIRADHAPLIEGLCNLLAWYEQPVGAHALTAGRAIPERVTTEVIADLARARNCAAEARELPLEEIHGLLLPAILELTHGAAVLYRIQSGRAWVHLSGEAQAREIDALTLADHYAGRCVLVRPRLRRDARVEMQENKGHWFWGVLKRYRRYYVATALAAAVINVLALAGTLFTMNVYDRVIPNQAYTTLWTLAVGATLAGGFELIFRTVRAWLLDLAGKKADLALGAEIFRRVMSTRLELRPVSPGAHASMLAQFESLRDFATSATLAALMDLPFLFFFLAVIFVIAGPLAAVPAVAAVLLALMAWAAQPVLAAAMQENLREASIKQGITVEMLTGIETLKALRAESVVQSRYEHCAAVTATTGMKSRVTSNLVLNGSAFVQSMTTIYMIVWGAYLIGDGKLTQGALIGAVMLAGRVMAPINTFVALAVRLQQARTSFGALSRLMEKPLDRDEGRQYVQTDAHRGDLSMREVSFAYQPDLPPAISGVSLTIPTGSRMAVLGRVGSGKSTLLKLLAGLYRPVSGRLALDGLDAAQVDPVDLRKTVLYVGQDAHLVHGTLRENLKLGARWASDEEMLDAAAGMGVSAIANGHPQGYDMVIGERGDTLSGGQRQAIALARAILAGPRMLLLDEPTSAMDEGTERTVLINLQRWAQKNGAGFVFVTHKPALLGIVERVTVLDMGKIVADGPRDAVLEALGAGKVKKGADQ